jgi:pyruvate formate lyase activating enzyme
MRDVPPTPVATLRRAEEIGRTAGLRYIYLGNVSESADTLCPGCGRELIRRLGFQVVENAISRSGRCPACGESVAGVGMAGMD